jgi:alanine racemase
MSVTHHPTHARIDLAAFRHNLSVVRSLVGPTTMIMAVVKANAYGHGMLHCAQTATGAGAEWLAVARVYEAFELRAAGLGGPILVFETAPGDTLERAIGENITLTASSIAWAEQLSAVASRQQVRARIHVKVDTGMARLGLAYTDAAKTIQRMAGLPHLEIGGIYSHFATSDERDTACAREQMQRFGDVIDGLNRQKVEIPLKHMANSGAIISQPESHFDIVRPGIMLYGYPPRRSMEVTPSLKPVMALVSRVSHIKSVDAGTPVSYNRRYYTPDKTQIATIPVGYGDGYSRLLMGKSHVLIHGKRFPVVGTICMDHLMVNLGMNHQVSVGDEVTLIGVDGSETVSCWELAEKIGTIPYEITCLITPRVPRITEG